MRGRMNEERHGRLFLSLFIVVLGQHVATARVASNTAMINVAMLPSSAKAKTMSKPAAWSVGDVVIASHNAEGSPRIDVLDPADLSVVKDSVDLVPACGAQSRTRGLSFSPRFSKIKLQLAVSCSSEETHGQDGKLVLIAAKNPQHPVLNTIPINQAAVSIYNKTGTLYVMGVRPYLAAAVASTSLQPQSTSDYVRLRPDLEFSSDDASEETDVAVQLARGRHQRSHSLHEENDTHRAPAARAASGKVSPPTVLFKLDVAQHTQPAAGNVATAATAATKLAIAAVMPASAGSDNVALDLGPGGTKLFYTLGDDVLKVMDAFTGQPLSDRPLPSSGCTALLMQFDGSILVACKRCLYHLSSNAAAAPLQEACLELEAPFGQYMALDPIGAHLLIDTVDGTLHSIRVADFHHVSETYLHGRSIGGVAVLGTLTANQQDCKPGHSCCPYGKVLTKGTSCRKASGDCGEDAVCDGVSPVCPPDNPVKASGAICRQPRRPCDEPARCNGRSETCPPFNPIKPRGTFCSLGRADNVCASVGECDAEGVCSLTGGDTQGKVCMWRPEDDLSVFKTGKSVAAPPKPSAGTPKAVKALRSLVGRRRRPLAVDAVDYTRHALKRGYTRAQTWPVCQGLCSDDKCVMTAAPKGCCILPGSRLDDSTSGGRQGRHKRHSHKKRRGTEEDLYCWDD